MKYKQFTFLKQTEIIIFPLKRSRSWLKKKKKKAKKSTSNSSTILSTKNPNKRRSEVASGRHQSAFLFSSRQPLHPFNEADANRFRLTGLDPRRRFIYPLATFLSWITVKNERETERERRGSSRILSFDVANDTSTRVSFFSTIKEEKNRVHVSSLWRQRTGSRGGWRSSAKLPHPWKCLSSVGRQSQTARRSSWYSCEPPSRGDWNEQGQGTCKWTMSCY